MRKRKYSTDYEIENQLIQQPSNNGSLLPLENNNEPRFYKDPMYLKKEKEELDKLYQEINEFENEVKAHFDLVKNSRTPGSFTFISKQTENILSLKKSKLDIIHEKINLEKISSDYEFKDTINKEKNKEEEGSVKFTELLKYINADSPVNIAELNNTELAIVKENNDHIVNINDILEAQFEVLERDGKIHYSKEEKAMKQETRNLVTKVRIINADGDWKFGVYDADTGERIKNYPTESEEHYELKLVKLKDGSKIAKDVNTGETFEVVYSKKAQELTE